MTASASVLLIDAADTADAFLSAMAASGTPCHHAREGETAWRHLAAHRPTAVIVDPTVEGADRFMRRLRDEYMGVRPRMIALAQGKHPDLGLQVDVFDAVLLRPVAPECALAAAGAIPSRPEIRLETSHAVEMIKLTTLGGEIQTALDAVARRLMLLFHVRDSAVLAVIGERQYVGTVGDAVPVAQWPKLWVRGAQAVNATAPVIANANGDGSAIETRFAVPIVGASGAAIGALCLFADGVQLYNASARDALRDLALRVGAELSWRAVHEHVTSERDQLRESAMLDPLLGVLSAAALEQALATEIARVRRSKEPLSVALIDVSGLRAINDHHGHVAGDAALRHVADTARQMVRGQDVVARYGGDELAVLLSATPVSGAAKLMDRICSEIERQPCIVGEDVEVSVSVTVGIASLLDSDEEGAAVLARAARAAARASARGASIAIAGQGSGPAEEADTEPPTALGPANRFEAGVTLGGMYQIVHEISRGAMGVVYRAEDLGLSRTVAIKMLRPDLVSDRALVARFREEASVLAAIDHENMVKVYAFGEDKNDVYFVMELVEGVSLDDVIAEGEQSGQWPASDRVVSIVSQIASALDAMHDAGVLHRDVKPGNVVLDRARDRSVLVDVGLAKPFGADNDLSGTPGFIAPETFRGDQENDMKVDVYGLAATAYAALLQRAPFGEAEEYSEILKRQLLGPPKRPSQVRREIPTAVDEVFARALAIDASQRHRTAGEFARALAHALLSAPRAKTAMWPALQAIDAGDGAKIHKKPQRRTMTLDLPSLPASEFEQLDRKSRGVLFRCAPRVLGMRNAASWMPTVARKNRPLADAMSPQTSPLSWQPTKLFLDLLREITSSGRNSDTFAREVARIAVHDTFRRFYPTKAEALAPENTLSAMHILWRRYHSWGTLLVEPKGEGTAEALLSDAPVDAGMCSFTAGLLEQSIVMSGGVEVFVAHSTCRVVGDDSCVFMCRWEAQSVGSRAHGAPVRR